MPNTPYIETLQAKRRSARLAKVLNTPKQRPVVTVQSDIGKKLESVVTALGKLDTAKVQTRQVTLIASLIKEVKTLQTAIDRQTVQIVRAISKVELNPQIHVPEPTVINNMTTTAGSKKKGGINLSDYRAHDIDDAPDGVQYIGFISMEGKWYICQSDDKKNTMRYYFGKGDYDNEWQERYSHTYKTLSEAIHGLAT